MLYSVTLNYNLSVNISNLNSSETVSAIVKIHSITIIEVGIRRPMAVLRMLYCVTLTYISKVKYIFETLISKIGDKKREICVIAVKHLQ